MSLDKKIISEIERYRNINNYILEQAAAPPPPDLGALAPAPGEVGAGAPPPPAPAEGIPPAAPETPQPIDIENDPDVEKIDDEGNSEKKKDDFQKQSQDKLLKHINNFLGSQTVQTIKRLSPSRGRSKNSLNK